MDGEITLERIQEAIAKVEHPEIAATLVDLGMVRDVAYDPESNEARLTLVVPFFGIPEAVRNYLAYSLYQAVKEVGAELKIYLAEMTEEERQAFFQKERALWRG